MTCLYQENESKHFLPVYSMMCMWKYMRTRQRSGMDIRYINAFDWLAKTKMSL